MYKLSHANLDALPKYLTLSYTWDGQKRTEDLVVNGKVLKVIGNITTLLPYVLEKHHTLPLWIDGVCIDQENDQEKSLQIPLMTTIYEQAERCVVWLGKSNQNIDTIIPKIPTLIQKLEDYSLSQGMDEHALAMHGLPAPLSSEWTGIYDLLSREWFTRIWTFQETVLPKEVDVMCGKNSIRLGDLARLSEKLSEISRSGPIEWLIRSTDGRIKLAQNGMGRLAMVQGARSQRTSKPSPGYTFLHQLNIARTWKCFNCLDKIYGLLGLAEQSLQDVLSINYGQTPADLYIMVPKFRLLSG